MSSDDTSDFHPRPGRIRDRGARAGRQPRSFVAQVLKAAAKASGGPLTSTRSNGRSRNSSVSTRPRKGRCSRIGRGQVAADRLKFAAGQRGPGQRMRRAVVKARIVRLKIGSRAALAISPTCSGAVPPAMAVGVSSMVRTAIGWMDGPWSSAVKGTDISSASSSHPKTAIGSRTARLYSRRDAADGGGSRHPA